MNAWATRTYRNRAYAEGTQGGAENGDFLEWDLQSLRLGAQVVDALYELSRRESGHNRRRDERGSSEEGPE